MGERRVLVTGAGGLLGAAVVRAVRAFGGVPVGLSRSPRLEAIEADWISLDLAQPGAAGRAVARAKPDAAVHCAALADADACEREPDRARATNALAAASLARACARAGVTLLFVSTDLVFDGEAAPYGEAAEPGPISVYGRTKREGETAALAEGATVVRLPLLYGRSVSGERSVNERLEAAARAGREVALFEDEWRTPLEVTRAAEILAHLARRPPARRVLHLGGLDRVNRLEFGKAVLRAAGLWDRARVRGASRLSHRGAPRPKDVSLATSHDDPSAPPRIGLREGLARVYGASAV